MAFDPEDLDPTIDFTDVPTNKVKWVEGRGQWVYWKGCSGLTVHEKNGETVHDKLSGQIILQPGIELVFVKGQVKEG